MFKVTQSCPILCDPMDCIVHGILQARVLEWAAFPFSRGSSQPRDRTGASRLAGDPSPAEPQGRPRPDACSLPPPAAEERKSVGRVQPVSSIWRPLAFLPVTLSVPLFF